MYNRRRVAIDALPALLAISGVALVLIGGRAPSPPQYRGSGLEIEGPAGSHLR